MYKPRTTITMKQRGSIAYICFLDMQYMIIYIYSDNISRKLMGQDLDSCSVEELKEITTKIEKSLTIVRSRKV